MMSCDEHQDIANKEYNTDGKCPYFEDDYKEPTEETLPNPLPIGIQFWLFMEGIRYLISMNKRGEKNDSDNV